MHRSPDLDHAAADAALLARDDVRRLLASRLHDPFTLLGRHGEEIRLWRPWAVAAWVGAERVPARRVGTSGLFVLRHDGAPGPHPEVHWRDVAGTMHCDIDPYDFPPQIGDLDLHLFGEGRHRHAYRMLGAHTCTVDGIAGTRFATWAPNAERVSVVGDFNQWDGRCHPMRVRGASGVWELFLPGVGPGALYRFELRSRHDGSLHLKADPYGQQFERRPHTASIVTAPPAHAWQDSEWMERRREWDWLHAPVSVYELHLGSWQRREDGEFLDYRELAHRVAEHAVWLGFTHIELMPVTEHPLDASWGYQATGYFAPTSRFGSPDDFRYFVDHCHQRGIGVLLDWVPAHFPRDAHALARFDGTTLYEHADPRRGEHRDWGTLIYDFGRNEVRNFLLASANCWLEEFHIDGLRVDAVASMLYLDYSREPGDWTPNVHGGRENLEAMQFLRELNELTHGEHPGTLTIAEESTAWPQVTRPVWLGGLGFSMKWNMGWMHDTLGYMAHDPVHRVYHHPELTFGLLYAFTENFLLPFSHDEVVHGKGSMLGKMPGDDWQRFANLRLLYLYQYTYPGAKLMFMGGEFAQGREWSHAQPLEWAALEGERERGVFALVRDLNHLYRDQSALHGHGFEQQGFEWIDCHDATQSVISYLRRAGDECCVVVLNFTPVPRRGYRIGVPEGGSYRELLNTDSRYYAGSDLGNGAPLAAVAEPLMGRPFSLGITLPPLAGLVLQRERS
ncbi:MAG: 1,4-alpha-glucan branching protein GlgB [Pseudomonadales bacterium]|nr:1,4-alpha-glucan branching protein GlgB [Pseudomonadales bacterium]MBP7909565.1 1,4-alpha-glucan branching protein GlgB [Pseudomonadales bacterium]